MPLGAVVVKEGQITGTGINQVLTTIDHTTHTEIQAVREACKRLNTTNFQGCKIYGSIEPCSMCISAIYYTLIKTLYFYAPITEPSLCIQSTFSIT
ncbi:nucleoside deaminase [Fictibacillus solisalsi]|uniref:nucleoside deaminase n=1 Tax=Fictibacillus solisalsi TaxID=459525 RepID=UPI001FCCEFE9|nr:nucleoside deaminase [Fictibacillus solisalsi]